MRIKNKNIHLIFSRKILKAEKLTEKTDAELITLFKNTGNTEVIGVLFKRYSHQVLGICLKYLKNREDSRDAVMQIFEKLFADLQKHNIENFKFWLTTVTKNHCLMQIRKARHEIYVEDTTIYHSSAGIMETDDDLHLNHLEPEQLKESISRLNPEQRTCIEMFYLKNRSYHEIAELTGYDEKKVKSYIQNGKRNLKIMLSGKTHE